MPFAAAALEDVPKANDKRALVNSWTLLCDTVSTVHVKVQRRLKGQGTESELFAELWKTSEGLIELERDSAMLLHAMKHVKIVNGELVASQLHVNYMRTNLHFQRIFSIVSICGPVQFTLIYQMLWNDHLPINRGGLEIAWAMAPRTYVAADSTDGSYAPGYEYTFGKFLAEILGVLVIQTALNDPYSMPSHTAQQLDPFLDVAARYSWDHGKSRAHKW